jgi:hypothetical protein
MSLGQVFSGTAHISLAIPIGDDIIYGGYMEPAGADPHMGLRLPAMGSGDRSIGIGRLRSKVKIARGQ